MKPVHSPKLITASTVLLAGNIYADFRFEDKDGMLALLNGDTLVTAFRTDYRVPYLYPLTSSSGANILRHWPMEQDAPSEEKDHPHHRGIWLSHGKVNGYDFWTGLGNKNAIIKLNSITGKSADGANAAFTADLTWTAEGIELVNEKRSHEFSKPNAKTLRIDIHSILTAPNDTVTFGDTKEGTLALRTDRTLRVTGPEAKSTLTDSNGQTNLATWGKRSNWVAYSGPDEKGEKVVVAIIDNPSSFRNPTHWMARDYGLLSANPFGIHAFDKNNERNAGDHLLKKGETLILKYTVIIHQGTLQSAGLDAIYKSLPAK